MSTNISSWESYTGRLILAFGQIELLSFRLVELWLQDINPGEYTLKKRLDLLIGHVERITDSGDEKKQHLKDLLVRAKNQCDIRNQVAHNPVILNLYSDSTFEHALADLRGEALPIDICFLEELAEASNELASDLLICVSNFTERGVDEFITKPPPRR